MLNAEPQVGCFTRLFSLNRKRKGTPSTGARTEDLTRRAPVPVGDVKTVPLKGVCDGHNHDEEPVRTYLSACPACLLRLYTTHICVHDILIVLSYVPSLTTPLLKRMTCKCSRLL